MLRIARIAVAAVALTLAPAAVASAQDYGPNATPKIAGTVADTGYLVTGSGFCSNTQVLLTINPTSASNEFPHTVQTSATGSFEYKVAKPTGSFTITATGQSVEKGCDKTTSIGPVVLSAGLLPPATGSQAPVASGNANDILPVTGSDTASFQVRNAIAVAAAGAVLVLVAGRRRSRAAHRSLASLEKL